jgi:hypothetical protein
MSTSIISVHIFDPIDSPELEIFAWEHGEFPRRNDPGPARIVPITSIVSQACRLTINHKTQILESDGSDSEEEAESLDGPAPKIWFTAGLTRVRTCVILFGIRR